MTLQVLRSPPTHHIKAVWRPEYDTGIAFDLRCLACHSHFGYFKLDETKPRTISMVRVVNELHRRVNDAQALASPCDGGAA